MKEFPMKEEKLSFLFDRLRETVEIKIYKYDFEKFAKEIYDIGYKKGLEDARNDLQN